ncbi:Tf2-11, partial [Mucuna pruriens]
MGLSLLAKGSMPLKFWGEAFQIAFYLINKLPTLTLQKSTPFSLVFHKSPSYHDLKIFGCSYYPYLWPYNKHKIQYISNHKGYICVASTRKTYIARHVQFDEKLFPFQVNPSFLIRHAPTSSILVISFVPFVLVIPCSNIFTLLITTSTIVHDLETSPLTIITSTMPILVVGQFVPNTFEQVYASIKDFNLLVDAQTEPKTIKTKTWSLVPLPLGHKAIGFGILAEIVSDNGTQFASKGTAEFCEGLKIKQVFTSVDHPQSNGQVEAANKVILRGLRKRLEEAKGRWAEELPQVLWSYHTTPHSTTNETPFRLTFGTEAMIPVEIGEPSPRTALFEPSRNEEELRANLDLIQEARELAHIKEYAIKARAARRYNKKVIPRKFKTGDLVLKKVTMTANKNKLTPLWEGPFRVIDEIGQGAYKLESLEKKVLPRTWNAASLRMYYS